MSVGSRLRELRLGKGWTQADLSERTGIKVGHVSKLDQDEGDPKLSTLTKLLEALECSPNALLLEPDTSRERTQDHAILSLVWERLEALPPESLRPVIEVLDMYCVAWEMRQAIGQTPRKWSEGWRTVPVRGEGQGTPEASDQPPPVAP